MAKLPSSSYSYSSFSLMTAALLLLACGLDSVSSTTSSSSSNSRPVELDGTCTCNSVKLFNSSLGGAYCDDYYCELKPPTASCFPSRSIVTQAIVDLPSLYSNEEEDMSSASYSSLSASHPSVVEIRTKRIDQVEIGDFLASYDFDNDKIVFSRVHAILHRGYSYHEFYQVKCGGRIIEATRDHLIPRRTSLEDENESFVYFADLEVGNYLSHVENDSISHCRVNAVDLVLEKGYISPATELGTIVVNDVVASCYASFYSHATAKFFFDSYLSLQRNLPESILPLFSDLTADLATGDIHPILGFLFELLSGLPGFMFF